jgi:hypothetical protein
VCGSSTASTESLAMGSWVSRAEHVGTRRAARRPIGEATMVRRRVRPPATSSRCSPQLPDLHQLPAEDQSSSASVISPASA